MPADGRSSTFHLPVPNAEKANVLRTIARVLLASLTFVLLAPNSAFAQPATAGVSQPVDGITGTVHSRRLDSGVPLGGIGAGSLQVMTDGRIGCATINNNWAFPTGDLPGCFAAVHVGGARAVSRILALNSAYGLPAVRGLDFDGLYPVANLAYTDPALPVTVSQRAFSPLIPHDIRNSSFPAAAFVFRVANSSGAELEISIALAWENTLGLGGSSTTGPFDSRAENTVEPVPDTEGFFAQKFVRLAGADTSAAGRLRNNASGEMTLMAAPSRPQAIVTTANWNAEARRPDWWDEFARDGSVHSAPSASGAGHGHPAGVICVKLTLKPREVVDFPFAVAWYTPQMITLEGGDYGHYYQNIWPGSYAAARGLLTEWHSLLALTEEWQKRILFSNLPRWLARRLVNSVSPLTTHTILTRDQSFALLEYAPGPTMPQPKGATWAEEPSRAGPGDAVPTTDRHGLAFASLSRRLATSPLLVDLFPILAARELRLFMARQATDGALPRSLGALDQVIGVPQAGSVAAVEQALVLSSGPHAPVLTPEALDDISAFLIQIAQYVFLTGDREFLQAYFPNIRQALAVALENTERDGLPATQTGHLTPGSASLYLAALRGAGRLCRLAGSQAFLNMQIHSGTEGALEALKIANRKSEGDALAVRCDEAARRAASGMDARFWTGALYANRVPGVADVSSIDQLLGVAIFDRMGGWSPANPAERELLPGARVDAALEAIHRMNERGSTAAFGPTKIVGLSGKGVPGDTLFCDIGGAILGDISLSITRGRPDDAISTLRKLDDTRSNRLSSPWLAPGQFTTAGDLLAAPGGGALSQAADWSLLAPLQGFSLDLTSGEMSISPSIPGNWRSLSAPIFAPTFWGRMEYHPTARGGNTSLRIDRLIALPAATATRRLSGTAGLLITRIRISGPPPRPANAPAAEPPVAHVSRGTTPLGVKSSRTSSGDYILAFESPVILTAGDRLEIDLH